jgi:hypothetical protein
VEHALGGSQLQIAVSRLQRKTLCRSAQQSSNTRHELVHGKGLWQVVVRTGVQTFHSITERIPRRQNQAGNAQLGVAQPLQQRQPVAVRKTTIEDQGAVGHLLERGPGGVDALHDVDGNACGGQAVAHQLCKSRMVLDQ